MVKEVRMEFVGQVNQAQLAAEVEALALPGVHSCSVFGIPGEWVGVYFWDAAAPEGQYLHAEISDADAEKVAAALKSHVAILPLSTVDKLATMEAKIAELEKRLGL